MNGLPEKIFVTSAPFSCGVSWMWNALFEVGLRVFPSGHRYTWYPTAQGEKLDPKYRRMLTTPMPSCGLQESFTFSPNIEAEVDHRLTFARSRTKTILFVRDGRDALYSNFRRDKAFEMSFLDFLREPSTLALSWYAAATGCTGLFYLPPAEYWAYFYLFWNNLKDDLPIHVVRFEDTKMDPEGELRKVLDFIEFTPTSANLSKALERASFEFSKRSLETSSCPEEVSAARLLRASKPNEWKERFTYSELSYFNGAAKECLEAFGYEWLPDRKNLESSPQSIRPDLPPSIEGMITEATDFLKKGYFAETEALLWRALSETNSSPLSQSVVGAHIIALYWTRNAFGDFQENTSLAAKTFLFFSDLNCRHLDSPSIQYAILSGIRQLPHDFQKLTGNPNFMRRTSFSTHLPEVSSENKSLLYEKHFTIPKGGMESAEMYEEVISQKIADKDFGRAAELCSEALARYPLTATFHCYLGIVSVMSGDSKSACEAYDKAITLNPLLREAHMGLIETLNLSQERQHYEKALRDMIYWFPEDPAPALRLVDEMLAAERLEEAWPIVARLSQAELCCPEVLSRLEKFPQSTRDRLTVST